LGRKSIAWWHDENIGKHELIKVKITDKVANYRVGATIYYPGDIVEVPEFAVCDFMERVAEPEPVAVPVAEESPEPEPDVTLAVEEPPKPTKKSAKKKEPEPEVAEAIEAVDEPKESD